MGVERKNRMCSTGIKRGAEDSLGRHSSNWISSSETSFYLFFVNMFRISPNRISRFLFLKHGRIFRHLDKRYPWIIAYRSPKIKSSWDFKN